MKIKDFMEGQEVFIVRMYKGRNTNPVIGKGIVKKVGTKYVTDTAGNKYQKHFFEDNMLVEKCDYGELGIYPMHLSKLGGGTGEMINGSCRKGDIR